MKIAIIGPGAMGCLFAALLTEGGNDVWLLDKREERAKRISENGIRLHRLNQTEPKRIKVKATSNPNLIGVVDLLIVSVKSYDTQAAIQASKPLVSADTSDTSILTLQNGIGNLERICKVFSEEQAIGGITSHGATLISDGEVRHVGGAKTLIGKLDGKIDDRLKKVASLLNNCGIETEVSNNIIAAIWTKLIINAAINPLTAILKVKNGELLKSEPARSLIKMIVAESTKIAAASKIKLLKNDMLQAVEEVCQATAENVSSMLQDILKGGQIEIDAINGALLKRAEQLGIETPVNRFVTELVKAMEITDEAMRRKG